MTGTARYDGIADWYDTEFQPAPLESETWELLLRLLGEGAALPTPRAGFPSSIPAGTAASAATRSRPASGASRVCG